MCLLLGLLAPLGEAAPELEVINELDFGLLALSDNSQVAALRLHDNGHSSSDSGFLVVASGESGEYRLKGLPPHTVLNLSFTSTRLSIGGFGRPPFFNVHDFMPPAQLLSDANGEAEFRLGAQLDSSGDGVPYADTTYLGRTQLQLRYWLDAAGREVSFTETLRLQVSVQNTLNIEELRPLSFGILSAHPHISDTARLQLAPGGELSSAPQNSQARIRALADFHSARLRVHGAAPFYPLQIRLQSEPIELRHSKLGSRSPHFIVRDFSSLPAGSGSSNAKGELDIHIGASLETIPSPLPYADGEYKGSYEVEVTY